MAKRYTKRQHRSLRRKMIKMRKGKMAAVKREGMTYNTAKSISVPNIRKYLTKNVYNFVRYINDTEFTVSSDRLAFTGYAFSFKLNDVINVTEFTTLFDSYQIAKVELEFCPDTQIVNRRIINDTAPVFTVPSIYVHRDLDNAIAPTSEDQMSQRQDCIRRSATDRFKYVVVPQVGREIYRSATLTAYETPMALTWLDCNYADVPHYGVHVGLTPQGSTNDGDFTYKVKAKYWLRFKTVI